MRFNFSEIDTENQESTMNGFKQKVIASIRQFTQKYSINFYIKEEQALENILNDLLKAFSIQKMEQKIYVIIDEYYHFANELLNFHTENFKTLVSKNGKEEESKLNEKQKGARKQIEEYINFEEIGNIKNLNKYIVIAINDKLYVEKV